MTKLKFITVEKLLEMQANGEKFKLVETLTDYSYNKVGHIPGAINLPVDKIGKLASKHLKKTDTIVVYCADYTCHASTNAAATLLKRGYKKVLDFKTGKKGWIDAGFKLEKENN